MSTRNTRGSSLQKQLQNSQVFPNKVRKLSKIICSFFSVKAGKCLPYERYLLYTARSTVQPGLHRFASTSTSSVPSSKSVREPTSEPQTETNSTASENEFSGTEKGDGVDISLNRSYENGLKPTKSSAFVNSEKSEHSRRPAKAGDPGFVSEFYNHSRLHYLSTWGAEFRVYVNQLHAKGADSFPARNKLKALVETHRFGSDPETPCVKGSRSIMHIDMDCFFVSVGLRNRPDLDGEQIG